MSTAAPPLRARVPAAAPPPVPDWTVTSPFIPRTAWPVVVVLAPAVPRGDIVAATGAGYSTARPRPPHRSTHRTPVRGGPVPPPLTVGDLLQREGGADLLPGAWADGLTPGRPRSTVLTGALVTCAGTLSVLALLVDGPATTPADPGASGWTPDASVLGQDPHRLAPGPVPEIPQLQRRAEVRTVPQPDLLSAAPTGPAADPGPARPGDAPQGSPALAGDAPRPEPHRRPPVVSRTAATAPAGHGATAPKTNAPAPSEAGHGSQQGRHPRPADDGRDASPWSGHSDHASRRPVHEPQEEPAAHGPDERPTGGMPGHGAPLPGQEPAGEAPGGPAAGEAPDEEPDGDAPGGHPAGDGSGPGDAGAEPDVPHDDTSGDGPGSDGGADDAGGPAGDDDAGGPAGADDGAGAAAGGGHPTAGGGADPDGADGGGSGDAGPAPADDDALPDHPPVSAALLPA